MALPLVLLAGLGLLCEAASADVGRSRDEIAGDPSAAMDWSEGVWSRDQNPVPGCLTFPGGVDTGPGNTSAVDSVDCGAVPNGWSWSVTIPGPFTLYYNFTGIPPGYRVCGQIFGVAGIQNLEARVWLDQDWIVCTDLDTGDTVWEGAFSKFTPRFFGGVMLEATRCGRIRVIPEGACCYQDGHCEYVVQAECPTEDWQEGVACDPNPCPPPVPVEETDWGSIKAHYR